MPAPDIISQTQSDDVGVWQVDVPTELDPGLHQVVVSDELGNTDEALLYIDKPEADHTISIVEKIQEYTIDRVQTVVHPSFVWAFLFLLLIIVLLLINMVRLGRQADKNITTDKKKRSFRWALLIAILVAAVTLVIGVIVQKQTNLYNVTFFSANLPETVSVSGAVVTPGTRDAVVGVDLTAGNTSIKTQAGARYNFPDIDRRKGIRLNHPELKRSVVVQPLEDGQLDIVFDPDLLNLAIDISIAESRGHFEDLRPHLISDVARLTYAREIGQHRGTIFGPGEESAQELVITPIVKLDSFESTLTDKEYGPVYEFYALKEGQAERFLMMQEDGIWKLLQ